MKVKRERGDERGAILVLSALLITALLVIVAIVIDLGATRSDRRGGQLAVDNAAAAAGQALADPAAGSVEACTESIAYLEATVESAFTITSARTCADFATACTAAGVVVSSDPVTATASNDRYSVTIQYPVIDTSPLLARTSTVGAADMSITPADGTPCQRLGIQLRTNGDEYFGGNDRTSSVHAVATGVPGTTGVGIPAFLMLERVDCGALVDNNAAGIYVRESIDGSTAGSIHVDSYATGDCSGSTKGYAVYGSSQSDGTTSIRVYPSTTATPQQEGSINVVATNGKAGAQYPAGLSVAPTPGASVVSRAPVDTKYNGTGSTAITNLHSAAYDSITAAASTYTVLNGWETVDCDTDPTGLVAKVYVDCNSFSRTATFPPFVTDVVFSGEVDLGNNKTLTVNAIRVTVKGALEMPQGTASFPRVTDLRVGGGVAVGNNGSLSVNSTSPTTCTGGTSDATQVAIFGGSPALDLDNPAALCSTAVYLAGPLSAANDEYEKQALDAQSPHVSCTSLKPCPKATDDGNTATGATFSLGGNVTVTWTAPDQHPGIFSGPQGIEDLALWMEGGETGSVGSGAELNVTGVIFAPNARLEMRSPASAVPRNAQFIARSLWLYQGNLTMRPLAGNVVEVPSPGTSSLIR